MVKAEYAAARHRDRLLGGLPACRSIDFYSILNKALATKPDAIDCIFGIPPCTSAIINQSRELGFNGPIFGPCTLGDANVVNAMISKPEYAHDILSYVPDVNSDKMTDPVKKLGEKIKAAGASFELDSLHLFDAISAILAAMKDANSIDPEQVAAAIDNGTAKGFDGCLRTGRLGFVPVDLRQQPLRSACAHGHHLQQRQAGLRVAAVGWHGCGRNCPRELA